ncbi:hypothetical protein CFOL_v3_29679 [Cephalotus follicularis]|uniref:Uncharacterized protein n=1 Tax=Cephalotus follicularis TaxID=3775 RepID=A0A1Q3D162_CEPFO|nr:hypothetical protein CFOL_v3_29679 [Cephalotus follicularis]
MIPNAPIRRCLISTNNFCFPIILYGAEKGEGSPSLLKARQIRWRKAKEEGCLSMLYSIAFLMLLGKLLFHHLDHWKYFVHRECGTLLSRIIFYILDQFLTNSLKSVSHTYTVRSYHGNLKLVLLPVALILIGMMIHLEHRSTNEISLTEAIGQVLLKLLGSFFTEGCLSYFVLK